VGYYKTMQIPVEHRPSAIAGAVYIAVTLIVALLAFVGPIPLEDPGIGDTPYFLILLMHFGFGAVLVVAARYAATAAPQRLISKRTGIRGSRRKTSPPRSASMVERDPLRRLMVVPEVLIVCTLLLFLFIYIFATNANMDYVQRFIESGGNLRLAVDSTTERLIASARYLPLLAVNLGVYLYTRVFRWPAVRGTRGGPYAITGFALLWVLLAVFLSVIALPSFLRLEGLPLLAWVSMVPLFLVLSTMRYSLGVFYGISYGVFSTLLINYWLGTFSLVSLQVVVIIYLFHYSVFMPLMLLVYHNIRNSEFPRFLVFPVAWTAFELARSSGFVGFPWGLVGHSQYAMVPLIQIAELTGIWGVSFVVVLFNSAIAETISRMIANAHVGVRPRFPAFRPSVIAAVVVAATLLYGAARIGFEAVAGPEPRDSVRVALIQQNSDPRKHEYERTLGSLKRLTDEALKENPDIVVWSETAFVPNIRRWGEEDPRRHRLARLVLRMREYQESIETHLVTGNDDYARVFDEDGNEIDRHSFNAAVMFSDEGERMETYHKVRLVPFTEYFPYERQLPFIYNTLQEFDVHFWKPGDERTVFEHPKFRFSTPICFEDMFPGEVRQFVLEDIDMIVNLTNDYWSLTPVQAKQHFAGGMFRAVENRLPLVRSTASGLTTYVDEFGNIHGTLPYYEEAQMVTDVPLHERGRTLYTLLGDWFAYTAFVIMALLIVLSVHKRIARRG